MIKTRDWLELNKDNFNINEFMELYKNEIEVGDSIEKINTQIETYYAKIDKIRHIIDLNKEKEQLIDKKIKNLKSGRIGFERKHNILIDEFIKVESNTEILELKIKEFIFKINNVDNLLKIYKKEYSINSYNNLSYENSTFATHRKRDKELYSKKIKW